MSIERLYHWKLVDICEEAPGVRSNFFECLEERPSFIAGQYVSLRLPGVLPTEGKAYSIASAPHELLLRIAVRTLGNYSRSINSLSIGDEVLTSAPYGFFYPEPGANAPIVVIAGGIGITPGMSIITDQLYRRTARSVYLLYSNRTMTDVVFGGELATLAKQHNAFILTHFLTRQEDVPPEVKQGRLDGDRILAHTAHLADPEFFLAGSIPFVRDLYRELKARGVSSTRLYTEGFF